MNYVSHRHFTDEGRYFALERNENFAVADLEDIAIRIAWPQVEIFADDIDRVQVLAAGDEATVRDLRIEIEDRILQVEQPQYGLTLNITDSHWLQVCIRVPRTWERKIHVSTIGGMLNARGLNGSRIVLDTVSGDIRANNLVAESISLKSIIGDIRAEGITSEMLSARTVSGNITLDAVTARAYKCTTVSGEQKVTLKGAFETMDVRSVSGDVTLMTDTNKMSVSMRSLSGRVATDGVELVDAQGTPIVRVTGVSADLKLICTKATQEE